MIYIYIPEKGFHLPSECIRKCKDHEIGLVCHPGKTSWANDQKNKDKRIKVVFPINNSEVDHPCSDRVVLPLSTGQLKVKFVPRAEIPDLKPYYGEIESLHRMGFRNFELYTLFGTRNLHIPKLLYNFSNKHAGKPGIVVANGPSLKKINISLLKNQITFGSNRIFYGYEDWDFPLKYWAIEDRLQIEENYAEYRKNLTYDSVNFYPFEYLPFLEYPNPCPVNHYFNPPEPRFSLSSDIVEHGFTVTHFLLQLACIMGCNPIYIVGLDHSYAIGKFDKEYGSFRTEKAPQSDKPDFWDSSSAKESTHFTQKYTQGDKRFVPPRPKAAELSYQNAYEQMTKAGIDVFNASPGTQLDVFPQISADEFASALREK